MDKEDKRKNNGGHKTAGRKPKAVEQGIVEKLSPLAPKAFKAIEEALDEGKPWAVKLWVEHVYGKAVETQIVEMTTDRHVFSDKDLGDEA